MNYSLSPLFKLLVPAFIVDVVRMNEFLKLAVADNFINMSGQGAPPSAEEMWEIILQQRKELADGRKELSDFRDYVSDKMVPI